MNQQGSSPKIKKRGFELWLLHSQLSLNGNLTHEWRLALICGIRSVPPGFNRCGSRLWLVCGTGEWKFGDLSNGTIERTWKVNVCGLPLSDEAEEPLMAHYSWWQNLLAKCTWHHECSSLNVSRYTKGKKRHRSEIEQSQHICYCFLLSHPYYIGVQ